MVGFLGIGGNTEIETFQQYTMNGSPNTGGGSMGKWNAKREECIKAAGGGEQTGRIVGASIGTGAASFLTGIPIYRMGCCRLGSNVWTGQRCRDWWRTCHINDGGL